MLKWTSVDNEIKTSPAWYRVPKTVRCDHHQLEIYCYRNELGDRIPEARKFGRTDWILVAGTDGRAIRRVVEAGLATWDGDDLVISHVCVEGQQLTRKRIEIMTLLSRLAVLTKQVQEADKQGENTETLEAQIKSFRTLLATARLTERSIRRSPVRFTAAVAEGDPERDTEVEQPDRDPIPPNPLSRERGRSKPAALDPGVLDRLRAAWLPRKNFQGRQVARAIEKAGAAGEIEQIVIGMRQHISDPQWRTQNPRASAASYIRDGEWRSVKPPERKAKKKTNGERLEEAHQDPRWRRYAELLKGGMPAKEAEAILEKEFPS